MSPLLSVVIPTFNRKDVVVEAIESILAQNERGTEIIVVDDGSTDGTCEHLPRLALPIRIVELTHTGRIGHVRNAGIRLAKGSFIAFLDSDDLWLAGKTEAQLEYLAAHPRACVVYTNQYRQERGKILAHTRFDDFPPGSRVLWRESMLGSCVQTSSVMMRREMFETVGLFNEDLLLYEDADLWSRLSERTELDFIEEPLVVYRADVDSEHLQDDGRLRVREARRFLALYEERRRGRRGDEEILAVQGFREELARYEARVAP